MVEPASQPLVGPAALPMFGGLAPQSSQPQFGQQLAMPFIARGSDRDRALDCMALAIAYEAGNEPLAGQQAVGQVILNRLRAPRFPKSVCGVVFDGSERMTGCQFTFTCDGALRRRMADWRMLSARSAAETVLSGAAPDWVGGATHYHADYVLPYWASTGARVTKIGAHIFYRMPGDAARPFTQFTAIAPEPDVARQPHRSARRRWQTLAQANPVAPRPMFAPWGLPVGEAAQP